MKRRLKQISIHTEIDLDEAFEQIEDEDLVAEMRRRGKEYLGPLATVGSDWFDRMRWFLLRGDANAALAMLDSEIVRNMISDEARAAQLASLSGQPAMSIQ